MSQKIKTMQLNKMKRFNELQHDTAKHFKRATGLSKEDFE